MYSSTHQQATFSPLKAALLAALSVVGCFGQITQPSGAVANGAVTNADNAFSTKQTMTDLTVSGAHAQFGALNNTGTTLIDGTNHFLGIFDFANQLYYGISTSLPSPAGTVTLGGYYKGLGVGGSTSTGGNPIFGVLNSAQSGNGIAATALTVYDTNVVTSFNNTFDEGTTGNITVRNPTAATSGANQGGPTHIWRQNYWNGSVSSADDWKVTPSLGAGTNPTSVWTLGYSGTSGAHSIALRAPVAITNAGANTTLTVAQLNAITTSYSVNLPTIAAGTGAGTTPTVTVTAGGRTNSGTINVTTGTGTPAASAVLATVTFNTAAGTVPANVLSCGIFPANAATAALSGTSTPYVSSAASVTSFVVSSNTVGLAISTPYSWTYHCQ